MKLSEWFPADQKPTINGWYDTRWFQGDRSTKYRLWWRRGWRLDSRGPLLPNQHRPWRGLLRELSETKFNISVFNEGN
jgi:hypothetical protein